MRMRGVVVERTFDQHRVKPKLKACVQEARWMSESCRLGEIVRDFASCHPYGKSILRIGYPPMRSARELAFGRRRVPLILRDDRLLTMRRIERTTFVMLMIAPKFAEMTHGAHLRRARHAAC